MVNSKRIVAVVAVLALIVMLVYPAISTGTVVIQIKSGRMEKADHVYLVVGAIRAHERGRASFEGWKTIANESRSFDLVSLEPSTSLARGSLSLVKYDKIQLDVSNVTWVFNKVTTKLQVQASQLSANLDFTVMAGRETVIMIEVTGHQEELQGTKLFVSTVSATIL